MNEDDTAGAKPGSDSAVSASADGGANPGSGNININLSADSLKHAGRGVLHFLGVYASLLVFITLTCVYAFLVLRINTYSNPIVTDADIESSDTPLPSLQVDEAAAQKLQSLKDNSVNVQTLFQDGRTSPF